MRMTVTSRKSLSGTTSKAKTMKTSVSVKKSGSASPTAMKTAVSVKKDYEDCGVCQEIRLRLANCWVQYGTVSRV